jgi:thiamine-phosphate pyrophosphorylase
MRPEQWAIRPARFSRGEESMSGSATSELVDRLAAARLYVVTSAAHDAARVEGVVRAACAGGAGVVQLRRKGEDGLATLRLAERCRAVTAAAGVLLVVNDRLDVAMACDADGVHLGQDDLPVAAARALWPGRLVGRSTHSLAQALAARDEGADYIGVGPVYATPTKPGRAAVGLSLLGEVAAQLGEPWFAIGGVDEDTLDDVLRAGALRVAVVRAVCDAPDVAAAARRIAGVVARSVAARAAAGAVA